MAKAQGIIGNFKGKVGNMVGYQLTDSNNKQTQGIRIYQPNVKNPKTSAQAEQRAKLAPINATYRALKMIIDRGNEGLPYGNKSRLAWLKQAFKAPNMPWFEKGAIVNSPAVCQITKGSLSSLKYSTDNSVVAIECASVTDATPVATVGGVSTALLADYPSLKAGDQITIVLINNDSDTMLSVIKSFVIDATSNEEISGFSADTGVISYEGPIDATFCAIVVSREGANGEHLRSNEVLHSTALMLTKAPYDATSKAAAIESYMASGAANTDWPQESID